MNPFDVVIHPDVTEKSMKLLESENKLVFVVSIKSDKGNIRKAVETLYEVKVENVNTLVTPKGIKKAYIKLSPDSNAEEVATRVGIF
ncbi:MAG: 50S ribosomal protein L23 [Candidatus Hydrothermarchaeaceae archaeon]